MSQIVFLSKGKPKQKEYQDQQYVSGIWKEQVQSLYVGLEKIDGDDVANPLYHGGSDRVVCVYPYEHYEYWQKKFGKELTPSAFGENLTVQNMTEEDVCIGDIFQIGDALLQVSQGRYPCNTINKRNENDELLSAVIETGFTGYFFRILKAGMINRDSSIQKVSSHPAKISVAYIHDVYFHQEPTKETLQKILEVEELAQPWREIFAKLMG